MNTRGIYTMCRTTRQALRLLLSLILTTFLASCGSGDSEPTTINLFSSAVYGEHSLAFDKAGTTLKAWGANGYGQLGIGTRMDKSSPTNVDSTVAVSGYSAFSIGGAHSVAIGNDGFVYAWGHNNSSQLGDDSIITRSTPVQVLQTDGLAPLSGIKAIAAGGRHTLALKDDGTVLAWGSNARGQLGDGTIVNALKPVQVGGLDSVVAIAAGGEFSLALKSDDTVWAWGSNSTGQLGDNSSETKLTPVQVLKIGGAALSGIKAISAGGSHALAIDGAGKIWAWGYNAFGQLGDGSTTIRKGAVEVVLTSIVGVPTAISAGVDHSLAVIGGFVYGWGYNKHGQLGNGAVLGSELPVKTLKEVVVQGGTSLPNIVSVIAVGQHSLARDTDGTVYSWGKNACGQLGDGTRTTRSYAASVEF